VRLTEREIYFLKLGLRLVATDIARTKPGPILVRLLQVDYNPTDYQPEGLTCAIVAWTSQVFGFAKPEIGAEFDKRKARYVFSFEAPEDVPSTTQHAESSAARRVVADHLQKSRALFSENKLPAAAEEASKGVWWAFITLLASDIRAALPKSERSDFETFKTLLIKQKGKDEIPPLIGRHLARITTWYPDLRYEPSALKSSKREWEEYLASANAFIGWAAKEVEHASLQ
jgi:hypothetical protein